MKVSLSGITSTCSWLDKKTFPTSGSCRWQRVVPGRSRCCLPGAGAVRIAEEGILKFEEHHFEEE